MYLALWEVAIILKNLKQLTLCILSDDHDLLEKDLWLQDYKLRHSQNCYLQTVLHSLWKYLSRSLKAVVELDDVWMLQTSHDLNLPLETLQLLFRTPNLWDEFESHHLVDTHGH